MKVDEIVPISLHEMIAAEKLNIINNSHPVAYTKLIPIGDGTQNLPKLTSGESDLIKSDEEDNTDCMIIESDDDLVDITETEVINGPTFTNPFLPMPNEVAENVTSDSSIAEHVSEETLSIKSDLDDKIDVKPSQQELDTFTLPDVKTENWDDDVKSELIKDTPSCSYINSELMIKTEENECNSETDQASNSTRENFLIDNPHIFTKFSGLPKLEMFHALLAYIEDDIEPKQGVTKFEQLFSVLAKLHKNEDNLYLNKYIFPAVYILIVELLHKKLQVLCKDSPDFSDIPEVLLPHFDRSQKIIIVGILSLDIKSEHSDLASAVKTVKYLIAYTTFGEVFFVSNAFIGRTDTLKLINYSGLLDKLAKDFWILFSYRLNVCAAQVKVISSKKRGDKKKVSEIGSDAVQLHTMRIVDRLEEHFQVLKRRIPDFMLHSEKDICFLDKLVFVCCMLLNMLPRITYT